MEPKHLLLVTVALIMLAANAVLVKQKRDLEQQVESLTERVQELEAQGE